jgi:aminoglycoside phosphotransferase family enzyme/predicted kinase
MREHRVMPTSAESSFAAARARIEAVAAAIAAAEGSRPRLVETAISWVLIGRTHAHKFKKPVRLPYLDFSTLAARRRFCEEELRLNRRFAPMLYLDVVEIRDSAAGPSFDGTGPVSEVAVRMQRFPDGALWSERISAGALGAADVEGFARRLAADHRVAASATATDGFGSPAARARIARSSITAIDAWAGPPGGRAMEWPALREWLERERERLVVHWRERLAAGKVRECHGDLHLANVVQLGDEAIAFDCIEFDPALRWIDPLDDAAFLMMDLLAHDRRDLAFRFLDGYLAASGDHDGLPALRFFLVSRALVRAQVGALYEARGIETQGGCSAIDYLRLAAALARSGDPRLAITHGLPGSGKSFVSQQVLATVGAIRARSDVERKRLFGLDAIQASRGHVRDGIYGAAATQRTYSRLLEVARIAVAAGWPTIVDAAFLRREERKRFAELAAALAAPFAIVDCRAGLPLLRERVSVRQASGRDASEADVAVLERLVDVDETLDMAEERCTIVFDSDASDSPEHAARRWQAMR